MTARKREPTQKPRRIRPAATPEGREQQLVGLAVDLVEERLLDGSATSQETTFYLKLGSTRERLEQERLRKENELLQAKVESMASAKRVEELYEDAIKAMRTYSGYDEPEEEDEYYDESY